MHENITPETLKQEALEKLQGFNKKEGSFANVLISGAMYEVWKWYMALNALIPIFHIDETSGEYIDRKCADYGIIRKEGETDKELVDRYYAFLKRPATSGNVYHYTQWALSVPGVAFAHVLPLWQGNGTVKVIIAAPDGGAVDADVLDNTKAYIEKERPIGACVTVVSGQEKLLDVEASVVLANGAEIEAVLEQYEQAIHAYCKTLTLKSSLVSHGMLVYTLLGIPGVLDVVSLTICNTSGNLILGDEDLPIPGKVVLTEYAT